jgi:hypothetical protein
MAAFAGTFTGTTSSSLIDVTAGTGTLAQLQADVDGVDPGIFTVSGSDPYTYTILGNRELQLNNNVTLNMQNKDDTLQWTLTANKYPILDILTGSIFNVGDGTTSGDGQTIIGDSGDIRDSYIYVYGSLNLQGTESSPVTFTQYRSIYFYTAFISTNVCDWDWVVLSNPVLNSGYMMAFEAAVWERLPEHTFHNITISSNDDFGYAMFFFNGADCSGMTFDNFTIDNTYYGIWAYAASFKMTNSVIKNIFLQCPHYGTGTAHASPHYVTAQTEDWGDKWEQPKVTYESCVFGENYTSSTTEYAFYAVRRGSVVLFKGCEFKGESPGDPSARGVYSLEGGLALYHGTTTFTDVTLHRVWANAGTHLHCRTLDLTVYDENGNYLNNARVNVRQKEGNETWDFLTRSFTTSDPSNPNRPDHDGQIGDMFDDFPVFVEKEETSTGVYVSWSNGGDKVHELTVSYPGYITHHEELMFTSDLTVEVTLELDNVISSTATKIYNSTLHNSTIY